jgi:hypothetical protein
VEKQVLMVTSILQRLWLQVSTTSINHFFETDTSPGQSCGGLEAYSASYHDDRIKMTILFNSGVLDDSKKYLLKELKAPVAYFLGGPTDMAYVNVSSETLPSFVQFNHLEND